MTVGVLQLELSIGDAMSLKDKRRVVLSLKDRISHAHNVSIAEVGALDDYLVRHPHRALPRCTGQGVR